MKVINGLPWTQTVWTRLEQQDLQGRLGHGILLVGQQGVGKRLLLREFAQRALCSNDTVKPCDQCSNCRLFNAGSHPDLLMVEPEEEGKQIKIEQVRRVTEFVNTTAQQGGRKVVLLGPSEAMNINASNALLKSLEEPSGDTLLLLYSHQPSALLATIKSRCQQHSLGLPPWDQALSWLQANSDIDQPQTLLRLAKGAPLRALSLAEQEAHIQYMQFCQDLKDLAAGSIDWHNTSRKWKAWNITWLLEWFYELALDCQKAKSGFDGSRLSIQEMVNESIKIAQGSDEKRLTIFSQKVVESIEQQRSQSNPNPIMLLETLLIDWLNLLMQSEE